MEWTTNLFGSLVSERISNSSSFDKKKKRGKYNLFFSRYSFKPCKPEKNRQNKNSQWLPVKGMTKKYGQELDCKGICKNN